MRTPHSAFPLMPLDITWNWRSHTISIDGGWLESEMADFTRELVLLFMCGANLRSAGSRSLRLRAPVGIETPDQRSGHLNSYKTFSCTRACFRTKLFTQFV